MASMAESSANAILLLAAGILIHVAWYDFWRFTIRNHIILVLLALYALWATLTGFESILGDLAAALILFGIGFVMWALRAMGAGDVKLYFALGLFMGIGGLGLFSLLLLIITAIFLCSLFMIANIEPKDRILKRLKFIRNSGKAPYAVLMCGASIPVIVMRLIGQT